MKTIYQVESKTKTLLCHISASGCGKKQTASPRNFQKRKKNNQWNFIMEFYNRSQKKISKFVIFENREEIL